MVSDAYRNRDIGLSWCQIVDRRQAAHLAKTAGRNKSLRRHPRDLLFADDCTLKAGAQSNIQESMDLLSDACDYFWPQD